MRGTSGQRLPARPNPWPLKVGLLVNLNDLELERSIA